MPHNSDIPAVQPAYPADHRPSVVYAYPPPPSLFRSVLLWFGRTFLVLSLLLNLFFLFAFLAVLGAERLPELLHSGDVNVTDKVAIVRVDGLIGEGFIRHDLKQVKQAAQDETVKAVVLAINSPGGSVTASDQLWKQIKNLQEGKWDKQNGRKLPVVVAMESVAASGGYYIAAPADAIFAQPTTVTGSIGVYAPFLDLTRVPERWGIDMRIIKKGELKGASIFHKMDPEEVRHWDDLVDASYQRFMTIVKEGRGPRLKIGLRDEISDPKGKKLENGRPFIRRLADGGVFTAEQAKQYGLVDEIGYLDDAIAHAKKLANLETAKVVVYGGGVSLVDAALGLKKEPPEMRAEIPGITSGLWYLTPGYEMAGLAGLLRNP